MNPGCLKAALRIPAIIDEYTRERLSLQTFVAERPPPPQIAYQELLMAAEAPAEYLS